MWKRQGAALFEQNLPDSLFSGAAGRSYRIFSPGDNLLYVRLAALRDLLNPEMTPAPEACRRGLTARQLSNELAAHRLRIHLAQLQQGLFGDLRFASIF